MVRMSYYKLDVKFEFIFRIIIISFSRLYGTGGKKIDDFYYVVATRERRWQKIFGRNRP